MITALPIRPRGNKKQEDMTFNEAVYTLFRDGMDSKAISVMTQRHEDEIIDAIHAGRSSERSVSQ